MACKTSYELHHHFPKLAEESGFTFNTHRPRVRIDWNKIRLVDVESLIRERKFVLVEQHLNDILDCVLESEFDVRILDEGVIKMFRLAQLAVEYQQFCRHYLDRSVYVLREEINALLQDLDTTKKDLREKEEEIKKLRKKSKYNYRGPLPYGNDNIATMILKTLSSKGDIFPSTSNVDALEYNKCSYCDKAFLNQLYLKSHLARRHPYVTEVPHKDDSVQIIQSEKENPRLNDEIIYLKTKLKEMEDLITKDNKLGSNNENSQVTNENASNHENLISKKTKDAEVSTSNEDYLLDKIEEWKKEEHEKYNKEINLLRTQIMDSINLLKEKDIPKPENERKIVEQLQLTINQQGEEILALKKELDDSKLRSQLEEIERKKEADQQISIWTKRTEVQSKQYDLLIEKLNEIAKEAQESRMVAEIERERAKQLQVLLEKSLNNNKAAVKSDNHVTVPNKLEETADKKNNTGNPRNVPKKKSLKTKPAVDHKTLEQLHRKAQELLSTRSTSSSDVSSTSVEKIVTMDKPLSKNREENKIKTNHRYVNRDNRVKVNSKEKLCNNFETETKQPKTKEKKLKSCAKQNGPVSTTPGSPLKVVRAKISEEVNNRLVSIGVDPLKSTLPQNIFRKQRMLLQRQHEEKSKRNRDYQKVKHTILTYLDSNTTGVRKELPEDIPDYISPTKITKAFSLTSVISNVKSKALSLVKSNDTNVKSKRKALNEEVAKKAMSLLKTPPGSSSSSPIKQRSLPESRSKNDSPTKETHSTNVKTKYNFDLKPTEHAKQATKTNYQPALISNNSYSDTDSPESDHKYYNSAVVQQTSKSIESLIKSTARRPSSASAVYNGSEIRKYAIDSNDGNNLMRTQSAINVSESKVEVNNRKHVPLLGNTENSRENSESLKDDSIKKTYSEENIVEMIPKQTKGVLKNASSTSSLNKKKVLFDMDAIQMKSVSASPSQSITEKSNGNEKYELGLVNLDGQDWDISSIENEPLENETKLQFTSRTSPKIAQLKQTIESQLARRNDTPSTVLVGGVDLLSAGGPVTRAASIGGSNTSLGSSILDDSDIPVVNNKAFVRPRRVIEKEDSELDISEYSIDGITNKRDNESF